MANSKTVKKRNRARLKHLYELYQIEPGDLKPSEIQELKNAHYIKE